MFGIRCIKIQPTTYLLQYRRGKILRESVGLAGFGTRATIGIAEHKGVLVV